MEQHERKLKNMIVERDQKHEKDVSELKRKLNTEIKMQSKS